MANRRDLTDRNREQQQPLQPIDFCQGLPFKVRWMGRDPQTGRDLVQFPDGSIVRAGKRIFSGNCPRGTMVDVVDCGANGAITIDWRDAEVRQPMLVPEVPDDWLMIIDCAHDRNLLLLHETTGSFFSPYTSGVRKYYENIKGTQTALLILHTRQTYTFNTSDKTILEDVATTVRKMNITFAGSVGTVTFDHVSDEDIATHDQIWIVGDGDDAAYGGYSLVPADLADKILAANKKIYLLVQHGSLFQTSPPVAFENSFGVAPYSFNDLDQVAYDTFVAGVPDIPSKIINKKFNFVVLENSYLANQGTYVLPGFTTYPVSDPIFRGVSGLFSGAGIARVNIPPNSGFEPFITVNNVKSSRTIGVTFGPPESGITSAIILRK